MVEARVVAVAIEAAHREHWASVLAATIRVTRDLERAEECAQEAFVRALTAWVNGVPTRSGGWLATTARRIALDEVRRAATLRRLTPLLTVEARRPLTDGVDPDGDDRDDRLRLLFTCCHPALSRDAQLALTLRLMCGLTTGEIGRVLFAQESAVAARITRAKQKVAAARVPFRLPASSDLRVRLDTVLTVVHLTYTAGHTAGSASATADRAELGNPALAQRAVAIARRLVTRFPDEAEAGALLALLLFNEARGRARTSADGELVLLADQDRSHWDQRLIREGLARATAALERGDGGRFTYEAAIAGLHASAPSYAATDWVQIVAMYDQLMLRWPTPIVALNRLAAISLTPGADLDAVQRELDALAAGGSLERYPYLAATRADVLTRRGDAGGAAVAYDEALRWCTNDVERRFLARRRSQVATH